MLLATSATRPFCMATSRTSLIWFRASMTWPPLSSRSYGVCARAADARKRKIENLMNIILRRTGGAWVRPGANALLRDRLGNRQAYPAYDHGETRIGSHTVPNRGYIDVSQPRVSFFECFLQQLEGAIMIEAQVGARHQIGRNAARAGAAVERVPQAVGFGSCAYHIVGMCQQRERNGRIGQ